MSNKPVVIARSTLFLLIFAVAGCLDDDPVQSASIRSESRIEKDIGRCDHFDPLRQPFFGDTHVHTRYSFDARSQQTLTGHEDAYRFARGGSIDLAPYDDQGDALRSLKLDRPLDFVAISDHSEFLGAVQLCLDPDSGVYNDVICVGFRTDPVNGIAAFGGFLYPNHSNVEHPELCGPDNRDCLQESAQVWDEIRAAAEAAYDRSSACEFTSFIGYEWSGVPLNLNFHRNVIFRNENVPDLPVSYLDEPTPLGLWQKLQEQCLEAGIGCDVLAIPHNTNISGELYFNREQIDGKPYTIEYARTRQQMEPIIEIFQHKGTSECLPDQPVVDELCSFELVDYTTFGGGALGTHAGDIPPRNFIRHSMVDGMAIQQELGINPYKQGIIASTDTHVSIPGGVDERSFPGHGGAGQVNTANGDESQPLIPGLQDSPFNGAGGLAVVWAEENSRDALFDAMLRREVYGTSGPRIVVRFFGGWDLPDNLCSDANAVKTAYNRGVPMGGDLPSNGTGAPVFFVSAVQDPGTDGQSGTPLERIQVIKGWVATDGSNQTRVYDVTEKPANTAIVDLATCEQSGDGQASICTTWTDPDFDPAVPAYYYARVLENPSCRWTTWACIDRGYNCADPQTELDQACCDPIIGLNRGMCETVDCNDNPVGDEARCCEQQTEPVHQERAWTSPIWYTPN